MRKNWSSYAWKLLWTIGLIALLIISFNLEIKVKNQMATTFNMLPVIWFQFIANVLLGIYLSLLFIKEWSVKRNWSLIVCVTLPFLIISIYSPIAIILVQNLVKDPNNYSVPLPWWLMKSTMHGIPAIVAGLSLMLGLFSKSFKATNNE